MPINWGIESKHYTCAAGQSLFSIFPIFFPPLIGFIGLIDTFPQKCGQNRPKLGVNQISPLTSIDSGKALWKFLAGLGAGLLGLPSPPFRKFPDLLTLIDCGS